MLDSILEIVSGIGTVANSANSVIDLVQKVKSILQHNESPKQVFGMMPNSANFQAQPQMQPFQAQITDPFAGGQMWMSQLQKMAGQFGNSWVPSQTYGFMGIDLTGIWAPPMNPYDQTYIRQYGPYLNIVAGIGSTPTGYGEGLFNPSNGLIHVVGKNVYNAPFEARAQLFVNWTIQGFMSTINPFGQPIQFPLFMAKVG